MSERSSGPTIIIVTLLAALIGSPLVLRYFETRGMVAPEPTPEVSVNVHLPGQQMMSGSGPEVAHERTLTQQKPAKPTLPMLEIDTRARQLSATDLLGLTRWQLDVMRNEVYARHGRRFNRAELQAYFDQQPWYTPRYPADNFPEGLLSAVERWNVEFIADYQRTVQR